MGGRGVAVLGGCGCVSGWMGGERVVLGAVGAVKAVRAVGAGGAGGRTLFFFIHCRNFLIS